ncbi:N,N'-diacetylchitobiose permease IIC component [compost metagenome]
MAPWTMPVGLGAFFNTNGSINAMILALVNLAIATLIYFPFVVVGNKVAEKERQEALDNPEVTA